MHCLIPKHVILTLINTLPICKHLELYALKCVVDVRYLHEVCGFLPFSTLNTTLGLCERWKLLAEKRKSVIVRLSIVRHIRNCFNIFLMSFYYTYIKCKVTYVIPTCVCTYSPAYEYYNEDDPVSKVNT